MEFTEAISAFGGKAILSPNGRYLARLTPSTDFILLIQETSSLSVTLSTVVPLLMDNEAAAGMPKSRHFPPPKPRRILPQDISIQWSPDSTRVMIVDNPVNRVFIFDHRRAGEDDGLVLQETLPTKRFLWAPDSCHIVSVLEHKIGIRVWSLQSRYPIKSITNIKSSVTGIDFFPEGNMMAVLHRKDGQDFIVIYNCATWNPIQVLRPPETSMLEDIQFATKNYSRNQDIERPLLYAWELPCLSSRLYIFEPDCSCKVVDVFCGEADLQESFGFTKVVPSPTSDLVALIGSDGNIVLWNSLLQTPITKLSVSSELSQLPNLVAFKERIVYGEESRFVKYECGFDLMLNELQGKASAQPTIPGLQAKFSADSKHLAIHSCTFLFLYLMAIIFIALFPNHLWIYHVPELTFVAVLCQLPNGPSGSIKDFDWHPDLSILGLVTGSDYIYFWQPEGCHCIPQPFSDPEDRCSRTFEWNRHGCNMMLLAGPSACCFAIPDFISS